MAKEKLGRVSVMVRLDSAMAEWLRREARSQDVDVSVIVRRAMRAIMPATTTTAAESK